ncbi:MAG: ABC transporter [Candidatus Omnitrophica bacterium CG07_land_8_20_14_0_80_50_8]|nr:MAG: ABC transporter [Candidatus Omnitrophica bacterium CG07_land_8_20_14_0_80_50_8]
MAPSHSSVIEINNLTVDYAHKHALDGLSLSVTRGEIFGFLGPNGAGKSTAIKTILGLIFPVSGSVTLHGLSPDNPESRRTVGFLPEEANYYRFLTVVEILTFYGTICGVAKDAVKRRIPRLLELVGLSEVKNKQVGTFSKGMTQKISLAQALIHEPETLILDEPTSGLDPLSRMELRHILKGLKNEGKTIFFSSHELSEVELLCDSIAILKSGRLIKSGPIQEVLGSGERNLERFFVQTIKGDGL